MKKLVLVLSMSLAACAATPGDKVSTTREYQKLVVKAQAAKAQLETFLQGQAKVCAAQQKNLSLDGDGFLSCVQPPAAPAPPKAEAPAPTPSPEKK